MTEVSTRLLTWQRHQGTAEASELPANILRGFELVSHVTGARRLMTLERVEIDTAEREVRWWEFTDGEGLVQVTVFND